MELEDIADADELNRRIHPLHIKEGGAVSSSAYKNRKGKPDPSLSVDLARLTTVTATRDRGGSQFGVAQILAQVPRAEDLTVQHSPEPDNAAHTLAEGENTKAKCRILAEQSVLVIRPVQHSSS